MPDEALWSILSAGGRKMVARRRFQRGSLKWDKDRWVIRWREDVADPSGNVTRVRKWDVLSKKDFPTKRLAERELERRLSSINSLDNRPTVAGTFSGFAERWKKSVMCQHKPSTQKSTGAYIKRLVESFGEVPMSAISAEAVQAWASELELAPKTVRNLVFTFKQMWATAKAWSYVSHDPFQGLRMPTWEKGNVYFFSLEQQLAIIAAAKRPWHKVLFRLYAETGVRAGEGVGIRPEDVGEGFIQVAQSVWHGKIQTPKNKNAIRRFPVSEGLIQQLREHIAGSGPNRWGLVFVNEAGNPILTDSFTGQVLDPLLKRIGIAPDKRCGLYAFRHGNATLMDTMRVPLKIRQARLGHADAETTLNHYTEVVSPEARNVAEQIGALFDTKGIVQ